MSKFIDRLQKTGTQSATPLGFGAATRKSEITPSMLLLGRTDGANVKDAADLSRLDAVLVSLKSWEKRTMNAAGNSLKDKLWGVTGSGIGRDQVELLKEKGCDFIVFDAENTAAAVLNDDELGKIISVDSDLDEETARAIQELPIDGVLFSSADSMLPLTVQKLIEFQLTRGLVDKPFVMVAPPGLGGSDLELLRNVGVSGLLVEASSSESVANTREAIAALPRRKPWARSEDIIAPQALTGADPSPRDDDEDFDF
mgnify:FL=1